MLEGKLQTLAMNDTLVPADIQDDPLAYLKEMRPQVNVQEKAYRARVLIYGSSDDYNGTVNALLNSDVTAKNSSHDSKNIQSFEFEVFFMIFYDDRF